MPLEYEGIFDQLRLIDQSEVDLVNTRSQLLLGRERKYPANGATTTRTVMAIPPTEGIFLNLTTQLWTSKMHHFN